MSDTEPGPLSSIAEAMLRQRSVLAGERTVISSAAPYGGGGLGRHLEEMVEAARVSGKLDGYLTPHPLVGDIFGHAVPLLPGTKLIGRIPPIRGSLAIRAHLESVSFDRAASRKLPASESFSGFNGTSLHQIKRARARGSHIVLVSSNAHMKHVARRYEAARRLHPIEQTWEGRLVERNLMEYHLADYVTVSSHYQWRSFLEEGFPEEKLRDFPLTPHPRYQPRSAPTSPTFNVVYVGSLAVHKGTPVLIEAFSRLTSKDLRLILVGGWGTAPMRRYIEQACAADQRILVTPGDPLPHLSEAGVYVHPSWSEGCAYGPAEANAVGVPLILSEDTDLRRYGAVQSPLVVPTGDVNTLAAAIEAAVHDGNPS